MFPLFLGVLSVFSAENALTISRGGGTALRSNHHGNEVLDFLAEFCRIPAGLLEATDGTRKQMCRLRIRNAPRESSFREQFDYSRQIAFEGRHSLRDRLLSEL